MSVHTDFVCLIKRLKGDLDRQAHKIHLGPIASRLIGGLGFRVSRIKVRKSLVDHGTKRIAFQCPDPSSRARQTIKGLQICRPFLFG